MFTQSAFHVEGCVTQVLSERTCRVRLENGHTLLGFVPGRKRLVLKLVAGEKLALQLSPYDLSEGRILAEIKTI